MEKNVKGHIVLMTWVMGEWNVIAGYKKGRSREKKEEKMKFKVFTHILYQRERFM